MTTHEDRINRHVYDLAQEICVYEDIESAARLRILIRIQMRALLYDVLEHPGFNGDAN